MQIKKQTPAYYRRDLTKTFRFFSGKSKIAGSTAVVNHFSQGIESGEIICLYSK